jgi:hypothetical protein
VLSGRGLCDELIARPEEYYRLCCIVVCDLETSRIGAPYIYDISHLRVKICQNTKKQRKMKIMYFPLILTEMSEKLHATHSFPRRNL